jgi:tetratricopeptide (TPR) repeat protein
MTPGPELDATSLASEIKHAATPARAASLRLTEQAREELADGAGDGALRDLGRAVSIDPGDPFEYYYLGRVYLARKNYTQALTFFQRSELGFAGRPDWLGETLTFEGACDEELGRTPDAAKAYQRAVAAAPDNLRARLGYGRLSPDLAPATGLDAAPPAMGEAPAPPPVAAPGPPPAEAPPPATDSRD